MKTLKSILFVFAAALLLTTAAKAQTTAVKADVPFDFVVGENSYPAGQYDLKSINDNGTMLVRNAQESAVDNFQSSHVCTHTTPSQKTELVFLRLGGNYFLYQIWIEGRESGREFSKSHSYMQLAKNHEKPEVLIVAANIAQ
ncbi:MAG: hypothetical protein WCE52_18980 [Candidatus Acidiferrum sp.]